MPRKTKYDPHTFPLLAQGYARDRLSDEQIAHNLGISKTTYYAYQEKYPEFRQAVIEGKKPVTVEIENSFIKSCKGYDYEEKHSRMNVDPQGNASIAEIKTITKYFPPNIPGCIFYLTNMRKDKYANRQEVKQEVDLTVIAEAMENQVQQRPTPPALPALPPEVS